MRILFSHIAEEHRDDDGLTYPAKVVTPFGLFAVALHENEIAAVGLATDLKATGLDVLLDDRDERPGIKFNEADLIGAPIRMTVSVHTIGRRLGGRA